MKKYLFVVFVVAVTFVVMPQLFGKRQSSYSWSTTKLLAEEEEEEKENEGPSDAVVHKLGAMGPDQKFKRGESMKSDGKVAPKDTTVYPIEITDAEGKTVLKLFFFKGENGKWSVYDEAGQVMHET